MKDTPGRKKHVEGPHLDNHTELKTSPCSGETDRRVSLMGSPGRKKHVEGPHLDNHTELKTSPCSGETDRRVFLMVHIPHMPYPVNDTGILSTGMRNVSREITELWEATVSLNVDLDVEYVPSASNPADLPSRSLNRSDARLLPHLFHKVDAAFGWHDTDLMALPSNVQENERGQKLRFFSAHPAEGDPGRIRQEAVTKAFLLEQRADATIVVPDLPRQSWWPVLQAQSRASMLVVNKGDTALLFPQGRIREMSGVRRRGVWKERPAIYDLWAFKI
ncbi:hypothetical protein Bbelb_351280 [Branchiostoma belcheri]|nr:hypothetical protein Bbelb_351280 [Branchiostoma belcheri]